MLTRDKEKIPIAVYNGKCEVAPSRRAGLGKYEPLLEGVVTLVREYALDTVCLNVADSTFSDKALRRFLQQDILPHVGIDRIDVKQFSEEMHIGKADRLEFASRTNLV